MVGGVSWDTQMEYPCMWLIYYTWCGQLLLSAHSCSGLWSTPLLYNAHASFQCLVVSLWPSSNNLLAGGYRYRRVYTLRRGRDVDVEYITTVVNMILCPSSSSLLMDEWPAANIFLWWSFLGKFQTLVKYRLSHCCGMIVINHSGMIVIKSLFRICSLAWLLCVQWDSIFFVLLCLFYTNEEFLFSQQPHTNSLWLLVIDVLLLQWFRKKRSFYFWEHGCICFV